MLHLRLSSILGSGFNLIHLKRSVQFQEDIFRVVSQDLPWETLSGQRILVTGANGFLGTYLVRTLLALNDLQLVKKPIHVVAMVRSINKAQRVFSDLLSNGTFELLEWDLSRIEVPDIRGCGFILHAASQASPRFYGIDPVGTLLPNATGTASLLRALQDSAQPRGFLFISSSEVYGSVSTDNPLSETDVGVMDPAVVRACYAESKRFGETLCVSWHKQFGLPTFIVRPFHTYGPGLLPEDGRVFADFIFSVLKGQNIVLTSDGSARRAFCYVSDAIAGFFTVLLKGKTGMPYNVANPDGELSVLELAKMMVMLYPEKKLIVESKRKANSDTYIPTTFNRLIPDVNQLKSLGWHAGVSPMEGFKRTIESYGSS